MADESRAETIFREISSRGVAAIDDFVRDRVSEELFLDFKCSSDQGNGSKLSNDDRRNLAETISAFGNSEGGVVVWGIDCSRMRNGADVAHAHVPIMHPKRFVSWLEGAVSGCTVPPHPGVRSIPIESGQADVGFAATLIPKSEIAPHQAVGRLQYFMRAGSSCVPVPHGVLAGMFGRRPQPRIFHNFVAEPPTATGHSIFLHFQIHMHNAGPGIATDLFVVAKRFWGNPLCSLDLRIRNGDLWVEEVALGAVLSMISVPQLRIPPSGQTCPLDVDLQLAPPFDRELIFECTLGCAGSPSSRFRWESTPEQQAAAYDAVRGGADAKAFLRALLGDAPEGMSF